MRKIVGVDVGKKACQATVLIRPKHPRLWIPASASGNVKEGIRI